MPLFVGFERLNPSGRLDTVKFLIHEGAKVNAVDKNGNTPLMLAAISGNPDVTAHLLDRGAIADRENIKGETALMLAAKHGRLQTVKSLVRIHSNLVNANQEISTNPISGST